MLDYVSWNLSRKRNQYRDADAIVLSLGKSGRTWLRVLLHRALSLHFQIPFEFDRLEPETPGLPVVGYTHELAAHFRDDTFSQRLVGKRILPRALVKEKKIVVLSRDPRDVVVSSWFHKTHRSKKTDCSLDEFVHHPRWGIAGIVWIMNRWRARFEAHPATHWMTYEDMRSETEAELTRLLAFLNVTVAPQMTHEAVEFASFDRMKTAEQRGDYTSEKLRPGEQDEPDSYKVRRGKVRGYLDYFDENALAFVDAEVAKLDSFYGYGATNSTERQDATEHRD